MAEQLQAFAFPFHNKITVTSETHFEEFPLQEISFQSSQNDSIQEKQVEDGDSDGLKASPSQEPQEQKNKDETEIKLPTKEEKEDQKESLEISVLPPKSFIFNEERSPIQINVETLKPQQKKTAATLFEDDLIDEDANHLLRYYH